MTDTTTAAVPQQGQPPLADTSDMARVHQVFREAIAAAPALIGSATARGRERLELVATYYRNVLALLHAHHDGEDELIWPLLIERAPDEADDVRRIAGSWVCEEVTGSVLETLVVGQEQGGPVAQAVLIQDAVQPGPFARAQPTLGQP